MNYDHPDDRPPMSILARAMCVLLIGAALVALIIAMTPK